MSRGVTTPTVEALRALAVDTSYRLASVVDELPRRYGSFQSWLLTLLGADDDVLIALGLPDALEEKLALEAMIRSDVPIFVSIRRSMGDRFMVYLGGVHNLCRLKNVPDPLPSHGGKVKALLEMLASDGTRRHHRVRTPEAVARGLAGGNLGAFRTNEIDTDLWVVLKTLQERPEQWLSPAGRTLIDYIVHVARDEIESPGSRVSDRRHVWWTARTLAEVGLLPESGVPSNAASDLAICLLGRPAYVPDVHVVANSLTPELSGVEVTQLWELINVAEMLSVAGERIGSDAIYQLEQREDALVHWLLSREPSSNMRILSITLRAAIQCARG